MLKIKPMLEVTKDGRVESIEKIRTTSKATGRLIEKFIEEVGEKEVEVFLIEANSEARADVVRQAVMEKLPRIKSSHF